MLVSAECCWCAVGKWKTMYFQFCTQRTNLVNAIPNHLCDKWNGLFCINRTCTFYFLFWRRRRRWMCRTNKRRIFYSLSVGRTATTICLLSFDVLNMSSWYGVLFTSVAVYRLWIQSNFQYDFPSRMHRKMNSNWMHSNMKIGRHLPYEVMRTTSPGNSRSANQYGLCCRMAVTHLILFIAGRTSRSRLSASLQTHVFAILWCAYLNPGFSVCSLSSTRHSPHIRLMCLCTKSQSSQLYYSLFNVR